MISVRGGVWRARLWLWLPAFVVVVGMVVLLVGYGPLVAVRVDAREEAIAERREELDRLGAERRRIEAAVDAAESTERGIETLYDEHFGTRAEGLTRRMARVKELARTAGLSGIRTISYPENEIEQFGLVRTSFVFGARGRYGQMRRFINLLEVTDSFLTLERVEVDEVGGGELSFAVTLSTLFERAGEEGSRA